MISSNLSIRGAAMARSWVAEKPSLATLRAQFVSKFYLQTHGQVWTTCIAKKRRVIEMDLGIHTHGDPVHLYRMEYSTEEGLWIEIDALCLGPARRCPFSRVPLFLSWQCSFSGYGPIYGTIIGVGNPAYRTQTHYLWVLNLSGTYKRAGININTGHKGRFQLRQSLLLLTFINTCVAHTLSLSQRLRTGP